MIFIKEEARTLSKLIENSKGEWDEGKLKFPEGVRGGNQIPFMGGVWFAF